MKWQTYSRLPRLNLTGVVNADMIKDLDRQIRAFDEEAAKAGLVIVLTTEGGSVGYARSIYQEIRLLQSSFPVTLVARGICLSAGVTIAMAVPRKRRLAIEGTKFLIHDGQRHNDVPINGPLKARAIQIGQLNTDFADDKEENRWVRQLIAKGCGQTRPAIRKASRAGLWLVGHQAVEYGLVSGLLKV